MTSPVRRPRFSCREVDVGVISVSPSLLSGADEGMDVEKEMSSRKTATPWRGSLHSGP